MRVTICRDCGGDEFRTHEGDLVCYSCGLVAMERMMDDRPEWRCFEDDEGETDERVGGRVEDGRLEATVIGGSGNTMMKRLHAAHCVEQAKRIDSDLIRTAQCLALTESGVNVAKTIMRDVLAEASCKGEVRRGCMAACVYLASMVERTPLKLEAIAAAYGIATTKLHRACNQVLQLVADQPYYARISEFKHDPAVNGLLTRMVNMVDIIPEGKRWDVVRAARQLIERVGEHSKFRAQRPSKIYATVIFIACKVLRLGVSKSAVSHAYGVSMISMHHHEELIQSLLT